MQIVIDIPEDVYKQCILANSLFEVQLVNYIANGTPLPKGHGRLIDVDSITKDLNTLNSTFIINKRDDTNPSLYSIDCNAPTIIEADKESEDKE